ncbi:MAG: CRTAC1 family protein [Planctomycetes bacterium]|nr:CRTAC1 family protein [Planctomycetota bacterium]
MLCLSLTPLLLAFQAPPVPPPAQRPAAPLFLADEAEALPGVTTTCGSRAKDYILEVNGGGVGLADFDNDGDPDLVVVDGSTLERVAKGEPGFPPRVFLNDGTGRFTPAGEAWAMGGGRWGMGLATGDVDGDGFVDLAITQWGPTRLFLNRGGKGLAEVTDKAGFVGSRWGTSAAFLDADRDGALDLAVINYLVFDPAVVPKPGGDCTWKSYPVMCGPEGLVPQHDQFYRGLGDGRFEHATEKAGFVPSEAGYGLGVMTVDYDADGDTDLYVANDSTPNHLWENQGDGTFVERGFQRGVSHDANGKEQASMGIASGDLDGDGRDELLVTNFSGESIALYASKGRLGFRERSSSTGLAGPSLRALSWGTSFVDVDLDGDLDAFVFNGHVYPQADLSGTDTSYAQQDQLFVNDGAGKFSVEPLSNDPPRVSRASAHGDIDGDGDVDIVALELDGAVRVLRNRLDAFSHPPEGPLRTRHWLGVRLKGRGKNTQALGARVRVEWETGSRWCEVRTSGGYQASIPAEVHFGLGAVSTARRVLVRWPSGKETQIEDVAVDRVLVLEESPQ